MNRTLLKILGSFAVLMIVGLVGAFAAAANADSFPGGATSGGKDVFACSITDLSTLPTGTYTGSTFGWASDYAPLAGQLASSFTITVTPNQIAAGSALYPYSGVNTVGLVSTPYTASYSSYVGGQWGCNGTHIYGSSIAGQPAVPQGPGRFLVFSPSQGCLNLIDRQVAAALAEPGARMAVFVDGYRLDDSGGKQYIGLTCDDPSKYGTVSDMKVTVGPNSVSDSQGLEASAAVAPTGRNQLQASTASTSSYEKYALNSAPINPYQR